MATKLVFVLVFFFCAVSLAQGICTHAPGFCKDDRCVRGNQGATLLKGQSLVSQNKKYQLSMQQDGNLVIYCRVSRNKPTWSTNTHHIAIASGLRYQKDGNLVLYRFDHKAVWASHTWHEESCTLVMQNDGNLVLYGCYGKVYWSSHTHGKC